MLGFSRYSRTLGAWLVACLLAVFVATPLLDAFVCGDEAVAATMLDEAGATATDVTASEDTRAPPHPDRGGVPSCTHGHCHHASVGAATASPALTSEPVHVASERPPASLALHSIDPALTKPPPRA